MYFSAVLLVLAALCNLADASHFRYGTASYIRDVANPLKVKFSVTSGWRYYTLTPDAKRGGYINTLSLTLYILDGTSITAPNRVVEGGYGLPIPDGTGEEYGLRTDEYEWVTMPSAGQFIFLLADCCRILTLVNAANNPEQLYGTIDTAAVSSWGSPAVNTAPIWRPAIGGVRSLNLNPSDPSGRAICTFANYDSGCDLSNAFPRPESRCADFTSGIRIAPALTDMDNAHKAVSLNNCILSWDLTRANPSTEVNKKWAVSVYVNSSQSRASVPVDWIIILSNARVPVCSAPRQTYTFVAGVTQAFDDIVASVNAPTGAPSGYYMMLKSIQGAPPGATFSPSVGSMSAPNAGFLAAHMMITPSMNDVGSWAMNFIFSDHDNATCSVSVVIIVVPPLILTVESPLGGLVESQIQNAEFSVLDFYRDPDPKPVFGPNPAVTNTVNTVSIAAIYTTKVSDVSVGAARLKSNILNGVVYGGSPSYFVPSAGIPCGSTISISVGNVVDATYGCSPNGQANHFVVGTLCCSPPPLPSLAVKLFLKVESPVGGLNPGSVLSAEQSVLSSYELPHPPVVFTSGWTQTAGSVSIQASYVSGSVVEAETGAVRLEDNILTGNFGLMHPGGALLFAQGALIPCGSTITISVDTDIQGIYSCLKTADRYSVAVESLCCSPPPSPPPPPPPPQYLYLDVYSNSGGLVSNVIALANNKLWDTYPDPNPPPSVESELNNNAVAVSIRSTYSSGQISEATSGASRLDQYIRTGTTGGSSLPSFIAAAKIPCGSTVKVSVNVDAKLFYSCDGSGAPGSASAHALPGLCCSPPPPPPVPYIDLYLTLTTPTGTVSGDTQSLMHMAVEQVVALATAGQISVILVTPSKSVPGLSVHLELKGQLHSGVASEATAGVQLIKESMGGIVSGAGIECGSVLTLWNEDAMKYAFSCSGVDGVGVSAVGVMIPSLCCSPPPSPPPPAVTLTFLIDAPAALTQTTRSTITGWVSDETTASSASPVDITFSNTSPSHHVVSAVYTSGQLSEANDGAYGLRSLIDSLVASAGVPCGSTVTVKIGAEFIFVFSCEGATGVTSPTIDVAVPGLCCSSPPSPPPPAVAVTVELISPTVDLTSSTTAGFGNICTAITSSTSPILVDFQQSLVAGGGGGGGVLTLDYSYTSGSAPEALAGVNLLRDSMGQIVASVGVGCGSSVKISMGSSLRYVFSCTGSTGNFPGATELALAFLCCSPPPPPPPMVVYVYLVSPVEDITPISTPWKVMLTGIAHTNSASPVNGEVQVTSTNSMTVSLAYVSGSVAQATDGVESLKNGMGGVASDLPVPCGSTISIRTVESLKYQFTCSGNTAVPLGAASIALPSLCCSPPPSPNPPPPAIAVTLTVSSPISPLTGPMTTQLIGEVNLKTSQSTTAPVVPSQERPNASTLVITSLYQSGQIGEAQRDVENLRNSMGPMVTSSLVPCGSSLSVRIDSALMYVFSCDGNSGAAEGGVDVSVSALCCSPPPSLPPPVMALYMELQSPIPVSEDTKQRLPLYIRGLTGPTSTPPPITTIQTISANAIITESKYLSGNPAEVDAGVASVRNTITDIVTNSLISCGSTLTIRVDRAVKFIFSCERGAAPPQATFETQSTLCCSPPPTPSPPPNPVPMFINFSCPVQPLTTPVPGVVVWVRGLVIPWTVASGTPQAVVTAQPGINAPATTLYIQNSFPSGQWSQSKQSMDVVANGIDRLISELAVPCGSTISAHSPEPGSPKTFTWSCHGGPDSNVFIRTSLCCQSPSPPPSPPPPSQMMYLNVTNPNGGLTSQFMLITEIAVLNSFSTPQPVPTVAIAAGTSPTSREVSIQAQYTSGMAVDAEAGASRIAGNIISGTYGSNNTLGFFIPTAHIPCASVISLSVGTTVKYTFSCDGSGPAGQAIPTLCCSPPPSLKPPSPPTQQNECDGYFNGKTRIDTDGWETVFHGKTVKTAKGSTVKTADGSKEKTYKKYSTAKTATVNGKTARTPKGSTMRTAVVTKYDSKTSGAKSGRHLMSWSWSSGFWNVAGTKTGTETDNTIHSGKTIAKGNTKSGVVPSGKTAGHTTCCQQCSYLSGCEIFIHPDGVCGFGTLRNLVADCRAKFCPTPPPPSECNGFFSNEKIRDGGRDWYEVWFSRSTRHLMGSTYDSKAAHTGKTMRKGNTVKSGFTVKSGNTIQGTTCCNECNFLASCDAAAHPDGFCGFGSLTALKRTCFQQFCPSPPPPARSPSPPPPIAPANCAAWRGPTSTDGRVIRGQCDAQLCGNSACSSGSCHGKCQTINGACPSDSCTNNMLGFNGGTCKNKYWKDFTKYMLTILKYGHRRALPEDDDSSLAENRRSLAEGSSAVEQRALGETDTDKSEVGVCGFDIKSSGNVFCDFTAYGQWMGSFNMGCDPTNKKNKCLGRLRCRQSEDSRAPVVPCPRSFAYEGADCFSQGNEDKFTWCRGWDQCGVNPTN